MDSTKEGDKKAMARIVLLGYEHLELGSLSYKSYSPAQSVIARNLLCQNTCASMDRNSKAWIWQRASYKPKKIVDERSC